MKPLKFLLIFFFISLISKSYSDDYVGILDYLKDSDEYSYFFKLIKKAKYEKLFIFSPEGNTILWNLSMWVKKIFFKYLAWKLSTFRSVITIILLGL